MPTPAEIAALRALVSRQARLHFVGLFEKTFKEVLETRKFLSGECISEEIAKECAKSLNVKGGVEMKDLHNHWREAEFTHTAYAPMPDPPKKGMPKGPDVLVRTIFSVAKKSGFLEFAYREVGDDGSFKGPNMVLASVRRPSVNDQDDDDGSSSGGGGKKK